MNGTVDEEMLLAQVDDALRAITRQPPPGAVITRTRALLRMAAETVRFAEIMTIEEVAAFLRISGDDLDAIIHELPAFELGGHIRVRRSKLIEWIEQRERRHMRAVLDSELALAKKQRAAI